MHTLFIRRSAERDLRRLPNVVFQRVNEKILGLREDPYPSGARKLAGDPVGWRIRVGDYRVIYQIDHSAQTVTIVRVKHRREVYR